MTSPAAHGTALARYFLNSSFVGTRELYCCGYRGPDGESSSAHWPHIAYFCPHCGEIWGREVLAYQFAYAPIPAASWVIETRRCERHGDGLFLTGKLLEGCSDSLLRRELSVLLSHCN